MSMPLLLLALLFAVLATVEWQRLPLIARVYLAVATAFAKVFGSESAFDRLERVRTHAELDGAPAKAPGKFPVLLFSHGYTGVPSSYTALLEDLASHGYAVLSVVHPYEATAATLTGGRVVSMNGRDGAFLPEIQKVFAEWASEDETMAAVTRETVDGEQVRLLRGYLGGLHRTSVALRRWVDDTKPLARLMEKLHVANNADLVHYALKHRLVAGSNAPD